jgi:RNA polymerase sigma factor (sigma-70 family)
VSAAKKYLWSGVALEDLIICGAIGLTLAADRFDATRGYRFLSYAVWIVDAELKKAVTEHWPFQQMSSLDATIKSDDEDEEKTLLDVIESRSEKAPDWAITYLSEMAATKEKVRKRHFDEAASILEDAIVMKEKGYGLFDVARKHRVSEEKVRQLLDMIKRELKDDFKSSSYHIAA